MRFRKEIMVVLKICKSSFHFLLYFKLLDTVPLLANNKYQFTHIVIIINPNMKFKVHSISTGT